MIFKFKYSIHNDSETFIGGTFTMEEDHLREAVADYIASHTEINGTMVDKLENVKVSVYHLKSIVK